ncbi:MAG: S9 family peptidase [Bryobacterales bacterium]|nr:S9 family peptidase [Bryobacterales bacterium]
MKTITQSGLAFLVALAVLALGASCGKESLPKPPETRTDHFSEDIHGVEMADPYRWLEDQQSPETRAWIDAQNSYTRSLLLPLPVREPIAARLTALSKASDVSLQAIRGDRYFLSLRPEQAELPALYWREGVAGKETLIFDPNTWSADKSTSGGMMDVSQDGNVLAYWVRVGGEDETEIRFRDLQSGADLPTRIARHLNRGFALRKDGSACYYTAHDREQGPRIHFLDLRSGEDRIVFGDGYTPDKFLGPALGNQDRSLLITVAHGWTRNDLILLDVATGRSRALVEGVDAHFQVHPAGDQFVIQTDWKAPRGRLMVGAWETPTASSWEEIVAEGPDPVNAVSLAGGNIYVKYIHNVTARIRAFSTAGRVLGDVDLPGIGNANLSGEWEEPHARLSFTSFAQPTTTYIFHTATRERTVFHQPDIPVRAGDFETKQVWVTSRDGTRVPMFLVHKKGLAPSKSLPTLLYGYGGFNVSLLPSFNAAHVLWMEQGGVFALANLRGGSEFGDDWHRAGMLEKKQNVFDDFLAAAEWLIANGYTNPGRLAIRGGSNGGLLVGAALTQRPDLFRAVLCQYPDLDMIGYHRFPNNNKPALQEYGDASKPEHFAFLRKYSPYQAVKDGAAYPAVLFTTGDADTRVPPLQARKMTARLQAATSSAHPVLLLYDTQAGHSGGKPQSKAVEDASLEFAFLFWQLQMEWREPR